MYSTADNSARVFEALTKFGAPLKNNVITAATFGREDIVYQIGVAPLRIDILTSISGVPFADAWSRKVQSDFFGVPVHLISLGDLIANKEAAGRGSDAEHLKQIQKGKDK